MENKDTKKKNIVDSRIGLMGVMGIATVLVVAVMFVLCFVLGYTFGDSKSVIFSKAKVKTVGKPQIEEMFLTPNKYSRAQLPLRKVKGVVIHYTANPGTDAKANRNYFEGLKDKHTTFASSHFIIGLDGTILQCIPLEEMAYASNDRNMDTISIECCHENKDGKFTKETYEALIQLTAWLCGEYNLKEKNILRHYDVTGKNCPKYYVENEEKWKDLKKDVFEYIKENGEKEE